MTDPSEIEGILLALIERLEKIRLPRALEIKERVDRGEVLNELDLEFLEHLISDAREFQHYIDDRPDLKDLYARGASLYCEIVQEALDNQKKS